MTIAEIYTKLKNPPNLQEHMLQVAKVALFIFEHWKGSEINKSSLITAALLHDVGNIVKFDIEKYPHFLGTEQKRADYWMRLQKEVIEKYGTDDHKVTEQMLTELGVNPEIIKTILEMSYWNVLEISKSDNWILKILLYADLRVSPQGVIPIRQRLDDLYTRLEKYKNRMDLYELGLEIEKQIQQHLTTGVSNITDETIAVDEKPFKEFQIEAK